MSDDAQATKKDIQDLLNHLQGAFVDIDRRFDAVDQRFDAVDQRFESIDQRFESIDQRFSALEKRMEDDKKNIKHHFDVVVENIKHDFLHGALPDKLEQHEDRLRALEQHTGLVAA